MNSTRLRSLVPLVGIAAATTLALGGVSPAPTQVAGLVEVFHEDGTMAWVEVDLPVSALSEQEVAQLSSGEVHALHETGDSLNRYDLVIVGDGYTQDELGLFHEHARAKFEAIAAIEPFTTYLDLFNIWMVDVVSPESGVDNDPLPGADVATALDMEFWCNGIERLLCVDQAKASAAASAAPEVDHVLVLANSTKYGGAGGSIATSSGDNAASDLITIHELGHSIGGLADEYEYYARAGLSDDSTEDVTIPAPGLSGLPGQEPSGVNLTAASSDQEMVDQELKWWRWLGEESPDGGTIGQYEGGGYSPVFIHRPTEDSLMHTLGIAKGGNLFNLVAIEAFIVEFHKVVDLLIGTSEQTTAAGDRVFTVEVEDFPTLDLQIRWYFGGVELEEARGESSLTIPALLAGSADTVTVQVQDMTASVRDPHQIREHLIEQHTWEL